MWSSYRNKVVLHGKQKHGIGVELFLHLNQTVMIQCTVVQIISVFNLYIALSHEVN